MIFLRVTPILPNWFINIVAPVIDVPLATFWLGTFIGNIISFNTLFSLKLNRQTIY